MFAKRRKALNAAAEMEACTQLLDQWLEIENEHTDPGFILPERAAVVNWCENHPKAVVVAGNVAFWAPLLAVMCARA
jgi:hypothetical protein